VSLISTMRDLHRRKARERRGLTLAEGVRLVEEALDAGVTLRGVAVAPALEGTARGAALKSRLATLGVALEEVSDEELTALAETEHPQGVVAVVEPRRATLDQLALGPRAVVPVLDAVQDPGNVGAVARAALGLGAAGLVALPGTADLANPKALRGSMGALFRLPAVAATPEELLAWAQANQVEFWATAREGEPLPTVRATGRVALLLGNEGAGLRPELLAAARRTVAIPLAVGVESLNVAVAAGIFLYEVTRER
jgi:TrmH family RNA methyltransferase